jgi:hypothetical protein
MGWHVHLVPTPATNFSRDETTVRHAHDGFDPDKAPRLVGDSNERGIEHHARAIASQSFDIKHVVGPVAQQASRHYAPEVAPMVGALLLWNHEIEGLPDRLAGAVAENVLGGLVPVANDSLAVRRNDRMRARCERGLRDGLFACRYYGDFSPLRERCTCGPDRLSYSTPATLESSSIRSQ